jgi:adenosine deaminase
MIRDELITMAKNSFRTAWITEEARAAYLQSIDDYVAAFDAARAESDSGG